MEKLLKSEPNVQCKLENYRVTADEEESAALQKSTEKVETNALTFIHQLKQVQIQRKASVLTLKNYFE